ncbi:DUF3425 domain-containing protein [Aspergillus puulaauensis]|uniref:BZIP domain-containing protein n=1 Tax=Aspergillus puulaauensis TaxID=1220207 RepID=A0A7R7XZE7_9EURO|nr:uncharacterized protein APUU_71228S [Aspergillus puulaauensis]BCS29658.1 hypothetical protein APUU_71228S [Aspergillus puulaauensis]
MPSNSDQRTTSSGGPRGLGPCVPSERRRQQNRINQRAYRRRKRLRIQLSTNKDSGAETPVQSSDQITPGISDIHPLPDVDQMLRQFSESKALQYQEFFQTAYRSYLHGDPTADHILTLTKVNVLRAFVQNLASLGWSVKYMEKSAISPFASSSSSLDLASRYSSIPSNLRPTKAQMEIPHHTWLDLFPLPRMRDNLIQAGNDWGVQQLCNDIMGFWGDSDLGLGLLVWGEPWDVRNWEITEPFLKKWSWVVQGCSKLLDSTNNWRSKRGENLIFRYI